MRQITVFYFIALFFLFRPFQLQSPGLFYPGDDYSYFAYSTSFAFMRFPDFQKEYVEEYKTPPLSRVGPGLMAAPFVAAFSLIDRATDNPIVEKRTKSGILTSWSSFGAVFGVCVYFWFALYFLHKALRYLFDEKTSVRSIALFVLCQGAALYAFRRPMFSHLFEFFLQSALLFLLIKKNQTRKQHPVAFVLLTALLPLVRQNAVLYLLAWPLAYFWNDFNLKKGVVFQNIAKNKKTIAWLLLTTALSSVLYVVVKNAPFWIRPEPYLESNKAFETSSFMFEVHSVYFYLKRTLTVLFGLDWGLLFTAPFVLLSLFGICKLKNPLKIQTWILSAPLLVYFYILLIWKGQGGWYGYRYFVFTAFAVWLPAFASLRFRSWVYWLAVFPVLSMVLFETAEKLQMFGVVTEFGERNAGNLTYQLEVWKLALLQPFYFLMFLFKAGPAYLFYLVSVLFSKVPQRFLGLYPQFVSAIAVKSILLYLLPWGLYFLMAHFESSERGNRISKRANKRAF